MADLGQEASRLAEEAERQLANADAAPFSPQAFHILKSKVSDYVRALIGESAKVSRRGRADVISAAHVEQASEYLITTSSRRWVRHLGTIGGILLGAWGR